MNERIQDKGIRFQPQFETQRVDFPASLRDEETGGSLQGRGESVVIRNNTMDADGIIERNCEIRERAKSKGMENGVEEREVPAATEERRDNGKGHELVEVMED